MYLLPYLSTSLRIGPFHFYMPEFVRGCSFTAFILCCCIFCYGCMLFFIVLDLVFQYLAKRLAGRNVSKMTYFVSVGT